VKKGEEKRIIVLHQIRLAADLFIH